MENPHLANKDKGSSGQSSGQRRGFSGDNKSRLGFN